MSCVHCGISMILKETNQNEGGYSWRCINSYCIANGTHQTIRKDSFSEGFKIEIKRILLILIYWASIFQQTSILKHVDINPKIFRPIHTRIISLIKVYNERCPFKLRGLNKSVQIDETMLNYKCKNHRGKSIENRRCSSDFRI